MANPNVTCIQLAPAVYSLDAPLSIEGALALWAEGGGATLTGQGSVQLLSVSEGAELALANLVLSDGATSGSGDGAAIYNSGSVSALGCVLHGLQSADSAAAIYNRGQLAMQSCAPC